MNITQKLGLLGLIVAISSLASSSLAVAESLPTSKTVYGDYIDWRVLSVSHRLDKNYVRSIVGNTVAIHAGRAGKTKPWPDGTVIAKLSWKAQTHPSWPQAIVPGEFAGAEAMVKDSLKYKETGGWGFGRWEGAKLVMNDAQQSATCFACHTTVKNNDYVFTSPAFQ
ncbi:cytochrome P460 family protein [Methylomonas sp. AM2-LC]|uniref:cytochrome P460 family protein n=1 Tax=Methylomonas sp. AM2-LC TaxID=3153301 RepID=UPI0032644FF4